MERNTSFHWSVLQWKNNGCTFVNNVWYVLIITDLFVCRSFAGSNCRPLTHIFTFYVNTSLHPIPLISYLYAAAATPAPVASCSS